MEEQGNYSFGQFVRDLAHYISPYRGQFWAGVCLRLTSDIARLYPVWALSQIVLGLSGPINAETLHKMIVIMVVWGIAGMYFGLTHNLSKFLGFQVAEKASLDIYKDCLAHLFKLDFAWQETENSGNKMKRIDKGLDGVNVTIRRIFNVLIEVAVNTVGIIGIFFTLNKWLSFSLVVYMVIFFVVGTYLLKRAIKQERVVNKGFEDLNGITFEALNNIHTIKALSIDNGVNRAVGKHTTSLIEKVKRRISLYQLQSGVLLTYEVVFEFAVVVILVGGIMHGRNDISLLVLFIGLFQKVSTSAGELTDVVQQLALAKIWVSRAMGIMRVEPEIENPDKLIGQSEYPGDWKEIKIRNLSFGYQKGQTLQGLTLTIRRGEKVGIVGLSGAGKSTLLKLLLDLYENYEGQIEIDDLSLKDIQRQSYINHVAVVLQDTELFDMTLRENIEIAAVGEDTTSGESLDKVIKMAHLTDVVEQLPQGVETVVGEKGFKLSGGQRQRVGIARALFRQPDILLLDEATSHLDAHSEKEIQRALEECMHKFTTIVIAHRLSTIKAMDKIVVLEKGRIVEEGNFAELLDKNGAFALMWQEQKI